MTKILKRLIAAYIDLMLASALIIPLFIIIFGENAKEYIYHILAIGSAFMIFKDIGGKSLGKLIFKLKITEIGTGKNTSFYKRILRNITLVVWPVEVLVMFFTNDHRRLGDMICGTNVVPANLVGIYDHKVAYGQKQNADDQAYSQLPHTFYRSKVKKLLVASIICTAMSVIPIFSPAAIICGVNAQKICRSATYRNDHSTRGVLNALNVISIISLIYGSVNLTAFILIIVFAAFK